MKHYNDDFFNKIIDGEIDLNSRQIFFSHLEKCEECSKEYNLLVKAHQTFTKLEVEEPPLLLNSMVMKRIVKVVRPPEGGKKFFITMLVALTSILLFLLGYVFNSGVTDSVVNQKPMIDFSKIDFSFLDQLLKPLGSFAVIFTPDFGGMLLLLAISVVSYFFIEKLKEGKN